MTNPASDIAFTPAVKAAQEARGSRHIYKRMEEGRGWRRLVDERLAAFIGERDSFYLATANAEGQPYIQHRGGPKGFLKILDEKTLAFADYSGNRQYISLGNLSENPKAYIFLMDYAHRQRIKLWGTAKVVEGDEALIEQVMDKDYGAIPERVILFTIEAWDINCPQHIPQRFSLEELAPVIGKLKARVSELEAELTALKTA